MVLAGPTFAAVQYNLARTDREVAVVHLLFFQFLPLLGHNGIPNLDECGFGNLDALPPCGEPSFMTIRLRSSGIPALSHFWMSRSTAGLPFGAGETGPTRCATFRAWEWLLIEKPIG